MFDKKRTIKYTPVVAVSGKRGMYKGETTEDAEEASIELYRLSVQDFEHEDALFRIEQTIHETSYFELDINIEGS